MGQRTAGPRVLGTRGDSRTVQCQTRTRDGQWAADGQMKTVAVCCPLQESLPSRGSRQPWAWGCSGDVGSRGAPRSHRSQAGSYLGQVVLVPQVHPHRGPLCLPPCKHLVPLDPAAGATSSPPLTEPPQDHPDITLVLLQSRSRAGGRRRSETHKRVKMGAREQEPHPAHPAPALRFRGA